jgi:mRNA degradation ribonuclease J1/J2
MKLTIHRGSKEIGRTCIELQSTNSRILIDFGLPLVDENKERFDLVDHSGFDSFAFLIESEDKKIFYSGDFRGHGRKSILFDNILKNPPKDIDYLLLKRRI